MRLFGRRRFPRLNEGALSALKTPTNPPAPTRLVPLYPKPDMELMGGFDGAVPRSPEDESLSETTTPIHYED
jgi:hypothetical protein